MTALPFTANQQEAIATLDRPLQIIACAGSGKTEVISRRIAGILEQPGVRPANIIAFTFTEKAAAELKDRVYGILEDEGHDLTGLAEMFIGTIHAYCLNLLQTYVPEMFKYSVLTQITQRLFIDRNSVKSGLKHCPTSLPKTPYLMRYKHSKLYAQILSILAEDDVKMEEVSGSVHACWVAYRQLQGEHAYIDYSTMLELAVQLLEADANTADSLAQSLRRYIEETVRYVVVDEYQDVNPIQERLISALTAQGANLCVVGDDDQTIYQWRGSEVSNILSFRNRYAHVHEVTLAENFRSTEGIVALGRIIAQEIPQAERLPKAMQYASHLEWERGDILTLKFASPETEAAWIADRLEAMLGVPFQDNPNDPERGLSWSDMAVLFRSVSGDGGPLAQELDRRKIPYIVKGLTRLFDSPVIQAVVAMFSFITGEVDRHQLEQAISVAEIVPSGTSLDPLVKVLERVGSFKLHFKRDQYNLQRLYLAALEVLEIREDTIPGQQGRGELVFYLLGKFSQVITDYETINFQTSPKSNYQGFVKWLKAQAPDYYDESDAEIGYGIPNAVTLSTIHAAKGMQWPVVFLPCLRRNRFPAKPPGGLGLFHVIPKSALTNPDRYRGSKTDELRLLYVAVTRAKKYLYTSWSPVAGNQLYRNASDFVHLISSVSEVSTADPGSPRQDKKLHPTPKIENQQIQLTFSELKYFFECPYQFKLRFLYGFNPPIREALGYGKGLHDALAEIHKRAVENEIADESCIEELIDRHMHLPYAFPELKAQLHAAAREALRRYFRHHGADLVGTIHSEKQIQLRVGSGVVVDGRIDLIKRIDTDEVSIVDFKSSERAQAEEITRDQLNVYAVGYKDLTGTSADLIEVLNLNEAGANTREAINDSLLTQTRERIRYAGESIREGNLPKLASLCGTCAKCDMAVLCQKKGNS